MTRSLACCFKTFPWHIRGKRNSLFVLLLAALLLGAIDRPHAAFGQLTTVKVADASALKPPPGARVAIVEFDDLECPTCAHFNPLLKQAAATSKSPWIRHDFLIPYHNWSRAAAVDARWFDIKSKTLGDEYRDQIFANQPYIYNIGVLNQFTQKFMQSHGIAPPLAFDPQGKLEAAVQADTDLGKRTGVDSTPTIFIVTAKANGVRYMQVLDPDHDLYHTIDQALAETRH